MGVVSADDDEVIACVWLQVLHPAAMAFILAPPLSSGNDLLSLLNVLIRFQSYIASLLVDVAQQQHPWLAREFA